jgi:nitroimidazol reductase NimA-like FMN-containing flavoprotein (pyridoxamine 5'-phosphate oxidase superfamily)
MRRKDKEITSRKELELILQKATICRIGLMDHAKPYIVPMNFGYKKGCLYFHSATSGKKIDIIQDNNTVCFEVDIDHDITNTGVPCNWSSKYQSVIGYGKAVLVEDIKEKREALTILIRHYEPGMSYQFSEERLRTVAVIKLIIESMTGKKSM